MQVIRILISFMVAFLVGVLVPFGIPFLVNAVKLSDYDGYYIAGDYLLCGLFYVVPGLVGLAICLTIMIKRQVPLFLVLIPLAAAFFIGPTMLGGSAFLDTPIPVRSAIMVLNRMSQIRQMLHASSRETGMLPDSVDALTAQLADLSELPRKGRYARRGKLLGMPIQFCGESKQAVLPKRSELVPGTIYYSISTDGKSAWLAAAVLPNCFGEPDYLRDGGYFSGEPWVIEIPVAQKIKKAN